MTRRERTTEVRNQEERGQEGEGGGGETREERGERRDLSRQVRHLNSI
jgi:hypothetical protein